MKLWRHVAREDNGSCIVIRMQGMQKTEI